jgi:hypothetical protein
MRLTKGIFSCLLKEFETEKKTSQEFLWSLVPTLDELQLWALLG